MSSNWRLLGAPMSASIGHGALMDRLARHIHDRTILNLLGRCMRRTLGARRVVTGVLASLRLTKHPDKTCIGRIRNGFDFPGFHLGPDGVTGAGPTGVDLVTKASRLYEPERRGAGAPDALGMMYGAGCVGRRPLGAVGGEGKTATRQDRRFGGFAESRDVRRLASVSCASRLSPTWPRRSRIMAGRRGGGRVLPPVELEMIQSVGSQYF